MHSTATLLLYRSLLKKIVRYVAREGCILVGLLSYDMYIKEFVLFDSKPVPTNSDKLRWDCQKSK